ncbi:hypothetical protein B0H19DRAFT_1199343 [Mycena capillaripes]|nr:hypothetical protein B0H19DRAFT_1199343 [Mycena capillaripes]
MPPAAPSLENPSSPDLSDLKSLYNKATDIQIFLQATSSPQDTSRLQATSSIQANSSLQATPSPQTTYILQRPCFRAYAALG